MKQKNLKLKWKTNRNDRKYNRDRDIVLYFKGEMKMKYTENGIIERMKRMRRVSFYLENNHFPVDVPAVSAAVF